jgi:hypothetical protein
VEQTHVTLGVTPHAGQESEGLNESGGRDVSDQTQLARLSPEKGARAVHDGRDRAGRVSTLRTGRTSAQRR